jgi:hypothetical protein
VNGYCSEVYNIEITEEKFFSKSEAPLKLDISRPSFGIGFEETLTIMALVCI